jgi:Concanavalin A-like lectin/glucanases superfamily
MRPLRLLGGLAGDGRSGWNVPARAWWVLVAAGGLIAVAAAASQRSAELGLGLAIFFFLVLLPLRAPLEAVFVVLATGWFPLELVFGWQHTLLSFAGGINVSGLRLLGAFLGVLIAAIGYRRKLLELRLPRLLWIGLGLYAALVAWALITVTWTPDKVDGLRSATKLAFPVLVAAVIVADPRGWGAAKMTRRLLWLLAGALAFATAFGFLGILPTTESPIWTWAGVSTYAIYAGIVAVVAIALIDNGYIRRILWVAVLALVQLPFTVTRIAIAATAAAILWMLGVAGVHRWVAPVGIVAAVAIFLFFPPIAERNLYEEEVTGEETGPIAVLERIASDPSQVTNIVRFQGRENLWAQAIDQMAPADYIYGHGLNAWFTSGTQPYPADVAVNNPALYWRLGEPSGRVAADEANDRDGTYHGSPVLGVPGALAGDSNGAVELDGNGDFVSRDYNPFVNGTTRTFEGWAWRDSTRHADTLFGSVGAPKYGDVQLRIEAGGNDVSFWSDTNYGPAIWKRAWPGPDRWVHWALVFNEPADEVKLVINGVSKGRVEQESAYPTASGVSAGAGGDGGSFEGKLDEIAVYRGALPDAQIVKQSVPAYETREVPQLHGEYLRLLYETGTIGVLLVLAAYAALMLGFIRLARRSPRRTLARATATAATGLIVLYLITAITDNTFDYYLIGAYVWAGFALAFLHYRHQLED